MKVKSEKIIIINGNDTSLVRFSSRDSYLSDYNLKKYTKLLQIGTKYEGFDLNSIGSNFKDYVDPKDNYINILLSVRGGLSVQDQYLLGTNRNEIITPDKLLSQIIPHTYNKPLKILSIAPHAEYFQQYLNLLNKGSVLITISDKDDIAFLRGKHNYNTSSLLEIIFSEEFKLEKLIKIYCISQKAEFDDPIIGIHDYNGQVHQLKLREYAKLFAENFNKYYSTEFENILNCSNINFDDVRKIADLILAGKPIEDFTFSSIFARLKESLKAGDFLTSFQEELKQYFYPPSVKLKSIESVKTDYREFKTIDKFIEDEGIANYGELIACLNGYRTILENLEDNSEEKKKLTSKITNLRIGMKREDNSEYLSIDEIEDLSINEQITEIFGSIGVEYVYNQNSYLTVSDRLQTIENFGFIWTEEEEVIPGYSILLTMGAEAAIIEADNILMNNNLQEPHIVCLGDTESCI